MFYMPKDTKNCIDYSASVYFHLEKLRYFEFGFFYYRLSFSGIFEFKKVLIKYLFSFFRDNRLDFRKLWFSLNRDEIARNGLVLQISQT
jgi:hypothetical protein